MPLMIVFDEQAGRDTLQPVCDHCGELIRSTGKRQYEAMLGPVAKAPRQDVVFLHQSCRSAYTAARPATGAIVVL